MSDVGNKHTLLQPAIELVAGLANGLVDKGLDPDLLAVFPGLDKVAKACSLAMEWKKRLDMNKILTFLESLKEVSIEDRQRYHDKMATDERFKRSVGETLASIPNLDDAQKPVYAARLFMAYLGDTLTDGDYHMLRFALARLYIPDIESLKAACDNQRRRASYKEEGNIDPIAQQRLAVCGLLIGPVTALGGSTHSNIGRLGCKFIGIVLNEEWPLLYCENCNPSLR